MKLYLAGPMTGIPDKNFPEFERVATRLRYAGHCVVSPHEIEAKDWNDGLRKDIARLVTCDALVRLEGWEKSKGAMLEHHIAVELGMTIFDEEFCI